MVPPSNEARRISVLVENRQSDVPVDTARYREMVSLVLTAEGVRANAEAGVTFVGPAEMAQLNEAHMGHDGPTDVLAFPIDLALPGDERLSVEAPTDDDVPVIGDVALVGDVIVCPAVAQANAPAGAGSRSGHDGSVGDELDLLVVHGVLHLLGMDHADPSAAEEMRARETEHLNAVWGQR